MTMDHRVGKQERLARLRRLQAPALGLDVRHSLLGGVALVAREHQSVIALEVRVLKH